MASAEELLSAGNPAAALSVLQQRVRENAADVKLRIFLFQLLAVLGQWQRALDQLEVCGRLDAGTLAMVNTYSPALRCERLREAVFAGRTAPHVFGPPAAWVAQLAQALVLDAQGHGAQAAAARAAALDLAPASAGRLNDRPFEWIADADSRLGPVLEVVINGRYGWLPFVHLRRLAVEAVADLRDLVWAPAQLSFANGGETVALLPARYAGSTAAPDAALQMARKTEWLSLADGQYRGLGQRLLSTDATDIGLLEVRQIVLDTLSG
jgi:type VI secretion system protein ImpE